MGNEQQELKRFLKEQVKWCESQEGILEEIENKLYEMKELAEYVCNHNLSLIEANMMNQQFNTLKQEVHFLEKQLHFLLR